MMREIKQAKDSDVLLPTISAVITQSRALFGQDRITKTVKALLDTGSQITIGTREFFEKNKFQIHESEKNLRLTNCAGNKMGYLKQCIKCNVSIDNVLVVDAIIYLIDKLNYDLIIGQDMVQKANLNVTGGIVQVNNMQMHQEPMKFILIDDGRHGTCRFYCTDTCIETTCGHAKLKFQKCTHFWNNGQVTIQPGETVLIQLKANTAWDVGNTKTVMNHRFNQILEFIGYNVFDDSKDLYVSIKNRNAGTTIFIQDETVLLCGTYEEVMILECNHLVETKYLPQEEREIHQKEYEQWLENRHKLVKEIDISDDIKISSEQAELLNGELHAVMVKNHWVFSRCSTDIGFTEQFVMEFEFNTSFDGTPINRAPYNMDHEKKEKVEKMLQELVVNGVIEPCNSSYNTSLLAIKKANTSQLRLVQAYNNSINTIINCPLSPIANNRATIAKISAQIAYITNTLKEPVTISTVDITSGFWCVPVKVSHRRYLAFKHMTKQYTFRKMPMGTSNSPSDFCYALARLLEDFDTQRCKLYVYIDDIIIIAPAKDAIDTLDKFLACMAKNNLLIKLSKCHFLRSKVEFLGYTIGKEGVSPIKKKIKSLEEYKVPTTLKECFVFMGLSAYYHRQIPELSILLKPLQECMKRKIKFRMTDEATKAVLEVQKRAKAGFTMSHLDESRDILIVSDASLVGLGATLANATVKNDKISDVEIIAYSSRALDLQETLLSSRSREILGSAFGIETFADFLRIDRAYYLVSDHLSLNSIFKGEKPIGKKTSAFTRIRRACAVLMEYQIKFIHLSNRDPLITLADALSRNPSFTEEAIVVKESDLGLGRIRIEHDLTNADTVQTNQLDTEPNFTPPPVKAPPLLSHEDLIQVQTDDNELNAIRVKCQSLQEGEYLFENNKQYIMNNELVHMINSKNFMVICIPKSAGYQIVEYIHHVKDHAKLQRMVLYMNKLNLDIKGKYKVATEVIRNCFLCQISSTANVDSKDEIRSLRPSLRPFENCRIDLMDFQSAKSDFKYILTVLDLFSLYLVIQFLPDKKSKTVAREISLIAAEYQMNGRSEITSDNGLEFCNADLDQALEQLNIAKLRISPLNPRSNRVERAHSMVRTLLKSQLHKSQWDFRFKIKMACIKYNNTEVKSHGFKSPFYVLHGYESDFLSGVFSFKDQKEDKDYTEYSEQEMSTEVKKWTEYYSSIVKSIAQERFGKFVRNSEELDLVDERIIPGDLVALKFAPKPGSCSKLLFNWRAPYLVKSIHLGSIKAECLHTRAIYIRNIRLAKKLNLDDAFSEMLKNRQFCIRNNFFYPLGTIQEKLSISNEEITHQNDARNSSENMRTLRSGKSFDKT